MTEHLPVAGVHARANIGDEVVAEQRHCPGDHLRYSGGDAVFVVGIDDPIRRPFRSRSICEIAAQMAYVRFNSRLRK